jgi:hypothetical protein
MTDTGTMPRSIKEVTIEVDVVRRARPIYWLGIVLAVAGLLFTRSVPGWAARLMYRFRVVRKVHLPLASSR